MENKKPEMDIRATIREYTKEEQKYSLCPECLFCVEITDNAWLWFKTREEAETIKERVNNPVDVVKMIDDMKKDTAIKQKNHESGHGLRYYTDKKWSKETRKALQQFKELYLKKLGGLDK